MYMRNGNDITRYVLIISKYLSSYIWLRPTREPSTNEVLEKLLKFLGLFGYNNSIVMDIYSHFKNILVRLLKAEARAHLHVVPVNFPGKLQSRRGLLRDSTLLQCHLGD